MAYWLKTEHNFAPRGSRAVCESFRCAGEAGTCHSLWLAAEEALSPRLWQHPAATATADSADLSHVTDLLTPGHPEGSKTAAVQISRICRGIVAFLLFLKWNVRNYLVKSKRVWVLPFWKLWIKKEAHEGRAHPLGNNTHLSGKPLGHIISSFYFNNLQHFAFN